VLNNDYLKSGINARINIGGKIELQIWIAAAAGIALYKAAIKQIVQVEAGSHILKPRDWPRGAFLKV